MPFNYVYGLQFNVFLQFKSDPTDSQAAHRMSRFPPKPEALTLVKMTRTAYAQLLGQKFFPPKIFSHWIEQEGTNQWRWRDVGMKIVWSKSSPVHFAGN